MANFTPPEQFLSEIEDLKLLVADLLACERSEHWRWPPFYLLYVDIDDLANTLTRTQFFFDKPMDLFDDTFTLQDHINDVRALFRRMGNRRRAILGRLYPLCRATEPSIDFASPRARLSAHVHPKSAWLHTNRLQSLDGCCSADGMTLLRKVLPFDPSPGCERIDNISVDCMVREQSFDIWTEPSRRELAARVGTVRTSLGELAAAMASCLVDGCTIRDLLHPSSR